MKILPLALFVTFSCVLNVCAQNSEKPNIIFILADDLGYGDLGCYGQKIIQTPSLDRMAKEGLKFTRHYAGSTVCGPSRSCLLTGRHTGHTYLRGNGSLQVRRDPHDIVLPRMLKDAGYKTAMIGKSGLACNSQDAKLPNDKGFDYFFGFTSHTDAHFYFPPYLYKNGEKIDYPNNKKHEGDNYSSELVIKDALKYIEDNKEGPFFLHLALQIPHASLIAKEKYKAMYRGKVEEPKTKKPKKVHYTYEPEPKATFAGMITYMDENVGLVLSKLKSLGIEKNTLVIFSSDNGAMSEGGHSRNNFNSSGILRGGKRDLYEGGIRVPTIAWWPGTVKAGRITDHISAFWDFAPTALELAGLPKRSDMDGISYVNELKGKEQKKHEYLYWEFHEQGGKQAVLWNEYKGVRLNTKKKADQPIELYSLKDDPSEQNNIADKHPDLVAKMKKIMSEARVPSEIFKLPEDGK